MVFPLLKRWMYAATGMASSSHKGSGRVSFPLHGYDNSGTKSGGSRSRKRSAAVQHPLSIPNDTAWASDEAIVMVGKYGVLDGGLEGRGDEHGVKAVVERAEGSKVVGRDIVMTREWKVSGE
jgi:hypothetical protein